MPEILDSQISLSDYLNSIKKELKQEIELLKQKVPDQRAHVLSLVRKYMVEPTIQGKASPDEPLDKEVARTYYNVTQKVKVVEVKVTIPFTGKKEVLNTKPATYTRVILQHRHQLFSKLVVFFIALEKFDEDKYHQELQKFINLLSTNLDRINNQVHFFNDGLQDLITGLVNKKPGELDQKMEFMEKIGLETKRLERFNKFKDSTEMDYKQRLLIHSKLKLNFPLQ